MNIAKVLARDNSRAGTHLFIILIILGRRRHGRYPWRFFVTGKKKGW